MKNLSDLLINMIEANTVPGPHRFGPFTDTLLAMVKRTGNKYESFFTAKNEKLIPLKPIPKDINPVLITMAPYLADDMEKSPFAKAEAEYMLKKIKSTMDDNQYNLSKKMITEYDEFTEEQRSEYEQYKQLFLKLK